MNDQLQRAQIKNYVHKAFLAKIMQMNEVRQSKKLELRAELGRNGHSLNSSAWMIGETEIEENCIADLLRQKAELYIDAYKRVSLKIGPDVLKDIAHSQVELTAARKGSLIGEAQLSAARTNRVQNLTVYAHLGKRASVAMKEIEANIDLYNLAHSASVSDGARKADVAQRNLHQDDLTKVHSPNLGGELPKRVEPDLSAAPSAVQSATRETIWAQMWSWVVVGTIDLAILGAGNAVDEPQTSVSQPTAPHTAWRRVRRFAPHGSASAEWLFYINVRAVLQASQEMTADGKSADGGPQIS